MSQSWRPYTKHELGARFAAVGPNGERLNQDGVDGVNVEKLAEILNDRTDIVPGWEATRTPPSPWIERHEMRSVVDGTATYVSPSQQLKVMLSCTVELDGRAWLHLSVSHTGRTSTPKGWRLPTWGEVGLAKRAFLGDREAYHVIPPEARYVNINERVLHLFALLDETQAALPDFTRGCGSI